jgi:hypothetical protein
MVAGVDEHVVIDVLDFRTKRLIFWQDRFEACCDELILCTDDGSAGIKGFVSDGIRLAIEQHQPDQRIGFRRLFALIYRNVGRRAACKFLLRAASSDLCMPTVFAVLIRRAGRQGAVDR